MLTQPLLDILADAAETLKAGFDDLPDHTPDIDQNRMREVLQQTAARMTDNYPYHHPYYIGQMLKPPHPVAQAAYMLATWINP
ncbi:MAG: aspartate aminotransferase family protein, partial [Chloroflexota bacterium]